MCVRCDPQVAFTGHNCPSLAKGESWWSAMGFGKRGAHTQLPQEDGAGSINDSTADGAITTPSTSAALRQCAHVCVFPHLSR